MRVYSLSQAYNFSSEGPKHSKLHSLAPIINLHSRGYEELSTQFLYSALEASGAGIVFSLTYLLFIL